MEDEAIIGRFAAIELMLGQLFVNLLENHDNPQAWLEDNIALNRTLLSRRVEEGSMSVEMADSAADSIQKVMQTASRHFETQGKGAAIS